MVGMGMLVLSGSTHGVVPVMVRGIDRPKMVMGGLLVVGYLVVQRGEIMWHNYWNGQVEQQQIKLDIEGCEVEIKSITDNIKDALRCPKGYSPRVAVYHATCGEEPHVEYEKAVIQHININLKRGFKAVIGLIVFIPECRNGEDPVKCIEKLKSYFSEARNYASTVCGSDPVVCGLAAASLTVLSFAAFDYIETENLERSKDSLEKIQNILELKRALLEKVIKAQDSCEWGPYLCWVKLLLQQLIGIFRHQEYLFVGIDPKKSDNNTLVKWIPVDIKKGNPKQSGYEYNQTDCSKLDEVVELNDKSVNKLSEIIFGPQEVQNL